MSAKDQPRLFFDLDGPILDVSLRHHRVYANAVRELGGTPWSREVFWEAKRRKTPEREILVQNGLDPQAAVTFQRLKLERIEAADNLTYDLLQPGMKPVLQRLARRYPLILVTLRNSRERLEVQLDDLGLTPLFTLVLSGRESDLQGWQIKCGLIRQHFPALSFSDWLVGDTETDILAGKHLGVRTVAVTNGIRTQERLEALNPDFILSTATAFGQMFSSHENSVR